MAQTEDSRPVTSARLDVMRGLLLSWRSNARRARSIPALCGEGVSLDSIDNRDWLTNPPYAATYAGPSPLIDETHRQIGALPVVGPCIDHGIEGWLRRPDALKLYELAYYADGDILEFGTYKGLSTAIMAQAAYNSGRRFVLYTVELNKGACRQARRNLKAFDPNARVRFINSNASRLASWLTLRRKAFGFIFVDHSHRYDDVFLICGKLRRLLKPGGFVLFHDFHDARNFAPDQPDYGVFQAVRDGLGQADFEFHGVYGCTGLFRRRPSETAAAH